MKKLLVTIALLLAASPAFATDAPVWRDSATATGKTPVVSLSVQANDLVLVFVASNGHSSTDLSNGTVTDNGSGSYDRQGGHVWKQTSTKWGNMKMFMRTALVASAATLTITADPGSNTTAIAVAVAISGVTLVDTNYGQLCQCSSIRQIKYTGQDVLSDNAPIMPSTTPQVPLAGDFQQQQTYNSTSMLFAVFTNETNPTSITTPSGWTHRVATGVTASGKQLGITIETRNDGFSGPTTVWGSTTPTRGSASAFELQPLQ